MTSILNKYCLNACLSKILHDRFLEDYEQLIEYQDQLTLMETIDKCLCVTVTLGCDNTGVRRGTRPLWPCLPPSGGNGWRQEADTHTSNSGSSSWDHCITITLLGPGAGLIITLCTRPFWCPPFSGSPMRSHRFKYKSLFFKCI